MNALFDALQHRRSMPARQLIEPAPTDEQIKQLLTCAITAPDHGALSPWRFIIIRNEARDRLGDVFVQVLKEDKPDSSTEKIKSVGEKPLRSPLIIAVVATIEADHPKIPAVEQLLSAGIAAHQLQLAATAMGFGSVWLSGPNTYHPSVKQALEVVGEDQIVGFIYIGTPDGEPPAKKRLATLENRVSEWHGAT